MNKPRLFIFWLTAGLVLALVLAAFALSYGAVYALALAYGWPWWAAYISPLMLDFVVVVGKMDILRRSLDKEARTLYPWTIVVTFSGLAVLFNVLHATPAAWTFAALGKQLFAALPPIVVLLAFHLFVEQVKARIAGSPRPARPARPVGVPRPDKKKRPLKPAALSSRIERQSAIPDLLATGMSPADLPEYFNVSAKTIRRDLAALNGHEAGGQ